MLSVRHHCSKRSLKKCSLSTSKKNGKAFAVFKTRDLGIQCDDTQLVCEGEGTLKDGTMVTFAGTSNEFKTVGRYCKDKDDDDHDDDDDDHKKKR